jgi:ElaB/YqjD/DUF883 family membrane-anchored ribosome-binding protein
MEIYFGEIEQAYTRLARERALLDLKTLIGDTEALVKATAQDVREETKEIRARVIAALERARSTCNELQQQGAAAGKAVVKRADTVIREHPYQTIGVAFGAGLLLGVLAMWLTPARD